MDNNKINEPVLSSEVDDSHFTPLSALAIENAVPMEIKPHHKVCISKDLAFATSTLSPVAQKLFYCAVSTIDTYDEDFSTFSLNVKQIKDYFPNIHPKKLPQAISKAVDEIYNASFYQIKFNSSPNEEDEVARCHIVRGSKYSRGKITFRFDEDLRPYLLKLQGNFAPIPMSYWGKFTSTNAMKLMEVLSFWFNLQFNKSNKREDFHAKITIPVYKLQYLFDGDMVSLAATGTWKESKYKGFKRLSEGALNPSIEQINNSGLLHITIKKEYDKKYRHPRERNLPSSPHTITAVTFVISKPKVLTVTEEMAKLARAEKNEYNSIKFYLAKRFYIPNDKLDEAFPLEDKDEYFFMRLKLVSISMQSMLNVASNGMYNKDIIEYFRKAKIKNTYEDRKMYSRLRKPLDLLVFLLKDSYNKRLFESIKYYNRNYVGNDNLINYIDKTKLLNVIQDMESDLDSACDEPDTKKEIDKVFDMVRGTLETNPNKDWISYFNSIKK